MGFGFRVTGFKGKKHEPLCNMARAVKAGPLHLLNSFIVLVAGLFLTHVTPPRIEVCCSRNPLFTRSSRFILWNDRRERRKGPAKSYDLEISNPFIFSFLPLFAYVPVDPRTKRVRSDTRTAARSRPAGPTPPRVGTPGAYPATLGNTRVEARCPAVPTHAHTVVHGGFISFSLRVTLASGWRPIRRSVRAIYPAC